MPRYTYLEFLQVKAEVPRGNDGIWSVILDLDQAGPWTARDVTQQTNVNAGTPRDYIRCLSAAGIVVVVGSRRTGGKNPQDAPLYRLTRRPIEAPRVRRDGSLIPEAANETLWRTMKMLKVFTASELADFACSEGRTMNRNYAHSFANALVHAGVLVKVPSKTRDTRYRLIRNVGARAPKILQTRLVLDPNTNTVIGRAVAREVSR